MYNIFERWENDFTEEEKLERIETITQLFYKTYTETDNEWQLFFTTMEKVHSQNYIKAMERLSGFEDVLDLLGVDLKKLYEHLKIEY